MITDVLFLYDHYYSLLLLPAKHSLVRGLYFFHITDKDNYYKIESCASVKIKMKNEKILTHVDWLSSQRSEMLNTLKKWGEINSGSENVFGLERMFHELKESFAILKGSSQEHLLSPWKRVNAEGALVEQPLGKALSIFKRPEASLKIFLGGHMDTVYSVNSPFQKVTIIDEARIQGPGVADMKGGLLVMLKALETLERSPYAHNIGWEILINPDEEIGTPGSESLFKRAAKRNQIGLLFEPTFPDGFLVSERKGSVNFTLVVHGKSAHAGRDFFDGKNAIYAISEAIYRMERLSNAQTGTTVNVGFIEGGGPVNIVPKLAIARINVRTTDVKASESTISALKEIVESIGKREGITVELHEHTPRPPKELDDKTQYILNQLKICGEELGIKIGWKPSGGVCDGNILASAGLPTVDTLGVVGGNLHTYEEYMMIDSLVERSKLAALLLIKLAKEVEKE